jgi:hypothetical protein
MTARLLFTGQFMETGKMAKYYRVLSGGALGHAQGKIITDKDFGDQDVKRFLDLGAVEVYTGPVDETGQPQTLNEGDLTDGDGNAVLPDGTNIGMFVADVKTMRQDLEARIDALETELKTLKTQRSADDKAAKQSDADTRKEEKSEMRTGQRGA